MTHSLIFVHDALGEGLAIRRRHVDRLRPRVALLVDQAAATAPDGWIVHPVGHNDDRPLLTETVLADGSRLQHLGIEGDEGGLLRTRITVVRPDGLRTRIEMLCHPDRDCMPSHQARDSALAMLRVAAACLVPEPVESLDPIMGAGWRMAASRAMDLLLAPGRRYAGTDPTTLAASVRGASPLAPAGCTLQTLHRRPMSSRPDVLDVMDGGAPDTGAVALSVDPCPPSIDGEDSVDVGLNPAVMTLPGLDPVARLRRDAGDVLDHGDAS